jgi:hypothetical protein
MEASRMQIPHEFETVTQSQQNGLPSANTTHFPNISISPDTVSLLLLVSSVLIAVPCILTFAEIRRAWKEWQFERNINPAIPCKGCHFFSSTTELNCAVHPSIVLTEDAVHCPDYCPKKKQYASWEESVKK